MQNKLIEELGNLLPKQLVDYKSFPSLEHCIGTNRILGTKTPLILEESLGILNKNYFSLLIRLSSLLRSYVVIDDYVKDTPNLSNNIVKLTSIGLNNIKNVCQKLILKSNGNSNLFSEYIEIADKEFSTFNTSQPYQSVINKCILFFLIFRLPIYKKIKDVIYVENKLKELLFSLQLMDDIVDIEEDYNSNCNHNIFTSGLNSNDIEKIKVARLPLLLLAQTTYLNTLESLAEINSNTLKLAITSSKDYITIENKKNKQKN
jgi:hypothetical protein